MSLIKDNLYDILNINLRIISDICLNILAIKRKNKICGHNLFFVSTFLDKVKTIIVLRERERERGERERERSDAVDRCGWVNVLCDEEERENVFPLTVEIEWPFRGSA